MKVYKLFRLGKDGKLYPLFINRNVETKLGEWLKVEKILDEKEIEKLLKKGLTR